MTIERASSTASTYAVAVVIGPACAARLDTHRLVFLDLLVRSFSHWVLPSNDAAAAVLAERADDPALSDALRLAFRRGAMAMGPARLPLAERVRGTVMSLDAADAAAAAAIARHAGVGLMGLLEDEEEGAARYLATRGVLSCFVALRYEQMVAGAALGMDVPINLLLLGAAPSNLAAISAQSARSVATAGARVGVCPSVSLASHLARVAMQVRGMPRGTGPGVMVEMLTPPQTSPDPASSGWFGGPAPSSAAAEHAFAPTLAATAGWRDLFALVVGGSVETDEEAILMGQAAGVPVFALDGPVSRELIRSGRTGFIFSPTALDEVRSRLDLMLRFADERQRVADAARTWVAQSASREAARLYLTSLVRSLVVSSGHASDLRGEWAGATAAMAAPRAPGLDEE